MLDSLVTLCLCGVSREQQQIDSEKGKEQSKERGRRWISKGGHIKLVSREGLVSQDLANLFLRAARLLAKALNGQAQIYSYSLICLHSDPGLSGLLGKALSPVQCST